MQKFIASAVQIDLAEQPTLEALREQLLLRAVQAARTGASVLVFPAYTGLPVQALVAGDPGRFDAGLVNQVARHGPAADEILRDWAAGLARQLDVYLVLGTAWLPGEDGMRSLSRLYGPDGRELGSQFQVQCAPWERDLGLRPHDDFAVFPTDLGTMCILQGTDARSPEAARLAALLGADLLLCPVGWPAPYSYWWQMSGLWQLTQANQTFSVEACLVGRAGECNFAGRSGIYLPCELTRTGSGMAAQAESHWSDEIVNAALDYDELNRVRREVYPIFREMNPVLYRKQHSLLFFGPKEPGGENRS